MPRDGDSKFPFTEFDAGYYPIHLSPLPTFSLLPALRCLQSSCTYAFPALCCLTVRFPCHAATRSAVRSRADRLAGLRAISAMDGVIPCRRASLTVAV